MKDETIQLDMPKRPSPAQKNLSFGFRYGSDRARPNTLFCSVGVMEAMKAAMERPGGLPVVDRRGNNPAHHLKVGTVTDIEVDGQGNVIATMNIDPSVKL